jgi:hypothetical protein
MIGARSFSSTECRARDIRLSPPQRHKPAPPAARGLRINFRFDLN